LKDKNKYTQNARRSFRIGEFLFDSQTGRLVNRELQVRLEPQVCEFLTLLIRHAGELVDRDMVSDTIWPNRIVGGDDSVRAMVKKLRDAFGDDARNPRYIKTLPLKGYSLIAPVTPVKAAGAPGHHRALFAGSALLVSVLVGYAISAGINSDGATPQAGIQLLTRMSGSELSPDYHPASNRLIFSQRANKDDYLQLYVKDLTTQRVQRLTWDSANYANAHWSPDGSELAYSRSTEGELQHFVADFDTNRGILDPKPLSRDELQGKYLLGWSKGKRAIYLKDAHRPQSPQGIWRLNLDSQVIEQITAPSVQGVGDFFASESADGKKLALLRDVEHNKRELLILDIDTGTLLHTRILPMQLDRLAWNRDSKSLTLSSFDGALVEYILDEDRFIARNSPSPYINDVFFQCGDSCLYMRQHNGNFLDLEEQPNPFHTRALMPSEHFDLPGAEDFPLYGPAGNSLYFASRNDEALLLHMKGKDSGTVTLFSLPRNSRLSSLSINSTASYLAGTLGKRIFVFSLTGRELNFLTNDMQLAGPPTWSPDGSALLYAKRQKGRPVIYRYSLESGQEVPVLEGYIAVRQLDDRRMLALDQLRQAWLLEGMKALKIIATLPSEIPNRWQVRGDWLYYTEHSGNSAYIHRISLSNAESEQHMLARNRFRLNFDIHPSSERIVAVKSLLAESDLIRLSLSP